MMYMYAEVTANRQIGKPSDIFAVKVAICDVFTEYGIFTIFSHCFASTANRILMDVAKSD